MIMFDLINKSTCPVIIIIIIIISIRPEERVEGETYEKPGLRLVVLSSV